MKQQGFTLIEMMVATVIGLAAVTSVYALGSAMSEQFFMEQRVASSQAASRVALMELRQDVSRAGLFGTPNASLITGVNNRVDSSCDATVPELPRLNTTDGPLGAFQFYEDEDILVLDPGGDNPRARADRLRILTSLYLTEQLLLNSTDPSGTILVLQDGNQAYRRTFGWGAQSGPLSGPADYLQGDLDWDAAWGGEAGSWNGIAMRGARAFQTGAMLHIETPEGRHFFRSVFRKEGNVQNEIRLSIAPDRLPIGTACLPGAAEGSTVAPLQWVEYAIVDPTRDENGGTADTLMPLVGVFADNQGDFPDLATTAPADLIEAPNRVLVRRMLDSRNGDIRPNSTQVIAEFVTHFQVSFIVDRRSGSTTLPPDLDIETDATVINANPEIVRAVIIDLGIRSPFEDPSLDYQDIDPNGTNVVPTRWEIDPNARGSARVRNLHIEIPVMSVGRKNLG
ncbi:MAG: prepilin-type N-terminal cleavage/methylation domain-containing protein [Myxococcota bacterium]